MSIAKRNSQVKARALIWPCLIMTTLIVRAGEPASPGKRPGEKKQRVATSQPVRSPKTQAEAEELVKRPAPKVGDIAPDFSLMTLDGKERIALARLHEDRPVVLIFGSFT